MSNQYSPEEYAYIEHCLDSKVVGEGTVDIIMNFLGDGLCMWCESEATKNTQKYCEDCNEEWDSFGTWLKEKIDTGEDLLNILQVKR